MPQIMRTGSVLSLALLFAGQAVAQGLPASIGEGEGQVNIVAWPGYIERGETDKAYDWVSGFEKETGCKVNVKTAATSDEMVTLMNNGGFDLVTASGDASLRLIAGKKVQPINTDLVPNWGTVDPRLKDGAWFTVGGQHYGTPYQWGPNVLLYNKDVFKEAPKSWSVVFEPQDLPDGKPNKGRVQAYDGPIYVADAANYLMHKRPELGIKDPYELNEEQYAAVLEILKGQRQLVGRYWHDAAVQVDDFKTEGVVASSSWPFQVNTLEADKQPVASTVPQEGATGWADTTMLATAVEHPNCAYKWLNHSLTPRVQATSPPGSAPTPPCRRPARRATCWAPRAATPTGSTISTRSASGARRPPSAPTAAPACPIRAGSRTTSP